MPASTRSKRKQEPHADAPVSKKRSGLSNISNFKSPRKLTHLNVNDKVPERYLPVVKVKRLAPASTTEVPSTQSGEFVLSQAPQEPPADGVKMMRNVKKVLEHNFKNVSDRLQLQSVPPCLYNLSRCHQSHVKKVEVNFAGSESVYLAKNFLEEERHTQFIMYVQNSMCGRKEFPGVSVVRGVLELILVRNILKFQKNLNYQLKISRKFPLTTPKPAAHQLSRSPSSTIYSSVFSPHSLSVISAAVTCKFSVHRSRFHRFVLGRRSVEFFKRCWSF